MRGIEAANAARRCCMLAHRRQNEEALRQLAQIPADKKENSDIDADKCPCDGCTKYKARRPDLKYLWQDHLIHYAFFWGFSMRI